ncbi:MAG: CoA transferase [Alphaproteobacteria bacterium]|nr:CoA transferase [Alphaproteobacteria bacterium]
MTQPNELPLAGVRVLEFGQIAAGPYAGSLLADLGADVVKIERPDGGDGMRSWPPLTSAGEEENVFSENFASLNRNKRSMAVDLKDPASVAKLIELANACDVIVENFRPGVLARLGLGHEALRQSNPKLVYCSISGYGQTGPYAKKGAFDVTVQGMSGLMSVTGQTGQAPVKCGVPVGDFCAGLYAAYTVLAKLMQARQTGEGGHIDCSMLGSLLGVAALQTSEYFGTGNTPHPLGSAHPRNAPYQAFEAKDDYFIIAAGNDRLWAEVADAVGMPELAKDERFATQMLGAKNQATIVELLQPHFSKRTATEWLEEMDGRGVPCSPINTYPDILQNEQVEHMQLVRPLELPNSAQTKTTAFPVAMSGYEFEVYRQPPELGAHNEEVFAEWLAPSAGKKGS